MLCCDGPLCSSLVTCLFIASQCQHQLQHNWLIDVTCLLSNSDCICSSSNIENIKIFLLQMGEFSWGETSRAPGSHLLGGKNQNPTTVCQQGSPTSCFIFVFPSQPPTVVDSFGVGHSSIPASPTYHHKLRTSSGDSCRQMRHNAMMLGEY